LSKTEVLVIGAGPAGLLAAREAALRGVDVLVLEEHREVGVPNHCAGLLSVEGLKRIGMRPSSSFIQHEIRGGKVYSPDGTEIRVTCGRTRAYVVDRTRLDKMLLEEAMEAGVEIFKEFRVESLLIKGSAVVGARGQGREIEAQVTIDAEGATATLARSLGLVGKRYGVLPGVNCEVSGVEVEPHMAEVWLGREIAPGFFAWVIPLGGDMARCGLACDYGEPTGRLRDFLERRFCLKDLPPTRRGFVLTGGPIPRTYGDGLLVVGDAAGQTKATTGGGVILGGLCAMKAGEVAAEAVERGDPSARFLRRYEDWWRRELGGEFSSMSSARRLLNRLSDETLNRLFAAFKREGLESVIGGLVEEGDMDLQRGILIKVLRRPKVLRTLIRILGRMALSEFWRNLTFK